MTKVKGLNGTFGFAQGRLEVVPSQNRGQIEFSRSMFSRAVSAAKSSVLQA